MNPIQLKTILKIITGKALGDFLGIAPQAVFQWRIVPTDRVLEVCRAIGWVFTPHELRPDIYPNPTDALPPDVLRARSDTTLPLPSHPSTELEVDPTPPPKPTPECGSVDPRHNSDRRSLDKRNHIERRKEGA